MSGFVHGLVGVQPSVRRRRFAAFAGALAALVGTLLRLARPGVRLAPGVGGAVLVTVGAWMAWPPAGVVAAGVFLLMVDRQT